MAHVVANVVRQLLAIVALDDGHVVVQRVAREVLELLEWELTFEEPSHFHVVHETTLVLLLLVTTVVLAALDLSIALENFGLEVLIRLAFNPSDALELLRVIDREEQYNILNSLEG